MITPFFKTSWPLCYLALKCLARPSLLGLVLLLSLSACRLLSPPSPIKPTEEPTDQTKPLKDIKIGLFISGAGANTFSALPLLALLQSQNTRFALTAGTGWGAWLTGFYSKNQNMDELKWNLLKLKEQGVFGTKWFGNKKKRIKILKAITKESLPSSLSTRFVCPALDRHSARILFLNGKRPAVSVLKCLQGLPPLFFSFFKKTGQGSLFSAGSLLEHVRQQVDLLIWIKPAFSLRSLRRDPAFYLFWRELSAYLNRQKEILSPKKEVLILETKAGSFSVENFSNLNAIIQTPVERSEQEKLKQFLSTNLIDTQ